ncbi:MAG: TetR/AcrR family transcriptional regulator [Verrucomicrobia bacterium]|nr:TetR/AcrR family transcriptional regulator [Verrucomicrobiota bacterium]
MSTSVIEQRKVRPVLKHKERRQREKEEMKRTILEAGMDLVKTQGISALTIRSLAERISYSTSIIYEYFKSKEEIFIALNEMLYQKLLVTLKTVPYIEDPEQHLLKFIRVNVDFFEKNQHLIELFSQECFGRDIFEKPPEFTIIRGLYGDILRRCHCKQLKTQLDIDKALDVIRSLRVGMLILSQYERSADRMQRVQDSLENGIRTLLKGWNS